MPIYKDTYRWYEMNILERLDMLEQKVEYFEKLISTGGNMDDTPFKYSRKKASDKDDISKLKTAIGIE